MNSVKLALQQRFDCKNDYLAALIEVEAKQLAYAKLSVQPNMDVKTAAKQVIATSLRVFFRFFFVYFSVYISVYFSVLFFVYFSIIFQCIFRCIFRLFFVFSVFFLVVFQVGFRGI